MRKRSARPHRKKQNRFRTRVWLLFGLVVVISSLVFFFLRRSTDSHSPGTNVIHAEKKSVTHDEQTVFAQYAGSASCQECHAEAFDKWKVSNHGLAERTLTAQDNGAFEPKRKFSHGA